MIESVWIYKISLPNSGLNLTYHLIIFFPIFEWERMKCVYRDTKKERKRCDIMSAPPVSRVLASSSSTQYRIIWHIQSGCHHKGFWCNMQLLVISLKYIKMLPLSILVCACAWLCACVCVGVGTCVRVRVCVRVLVCRTGSAMERRAITPPVGSPVGRPLYLPPPDKALLSLDKIAKRECKVLVLEPICWETDGGRRRALERKRVTGKQELNKK